MVSGDPDGYRNVVGRASEGNWKKAMETQQKLGPAVVIGCMKRGSMSGGSWTEGDMGLDCICLSLA